MKNVFTKFKRSRLILSFIAVVALFSCLYFSCEDRQEELIFDYRFTPSVGMVDANQAGKLFVNVPSELYLKLEKTNGKIGEYQFFYELEEGAGTLQFDGKEIEQNQRIILDKDYYKFTFMPTRKGKHKLKLNVINENYEKIIEHELEASQQFFNTNTKEFPDKLLIDKRFSFKLDVADAFGSSDSEYKATAEITKGKGQLFCYNPNTVNDEGKISRTKAADTTKLKSVTTEEISEKDIKPLTTLKSGTNVLYYLAEDKGANMVSLTIENEYGKTEKVDIPLNIELPDFSMTLTKNEEANPLAGVDYNFLLNVTDTDLHGNNLYKVSYRAIKNPGSLKINNNELQTGAVLELLEGDNVCVFNPDNVGETKLEFIVTDKYGTSKKQAIEFNVDNSDMTLEVSNNMSDITVNKESLFNLAVSKPNYKGEYQLTITQEPFEFGTIKMGSAEYTGGAITITKPENTVIRFTPGKTGNVKLACKITDKFGGVVTKEVPFVVSNSDIQVNVVNRATDLIVGKESGFTFSADKANYSGKFTYSVSQTPADIADIKIAGKNYTGGEIEAMTLKNIDVSFVPKKEGDVTISLIIKDQFGGIKQKDLKYTTINPDIAVETTNYKDAAIYRTETLFNLALSKKFYEGGFNYTISTTPEYCAMVKVDGVHYEGGKQKIANPDNVKIGVTSLEKGDISVTVNITDEVGGGISKTYNFTVTDPQLSLTTTNVNSDITLDKQTSFNFAVSKAKYTKTYEYQITQEPADFGTILVNNKEYTGGIATIDKPASTAVKFIPRKTGNVTLSLLVNDEYNNEQTEDIIFNVSNSDIELEVINQSLDLIVGKSSNVIFSADKSAYSGKYRYEIKQTPAGSADININGKEYLGGLVKMDAIKDVTLDIIAKTNDNFALTIVVKDDFGGTKEKSYTYNVSNPDINIEVSNYVENAVLQKPLVLNIAASKLYYTDNFTYSIAQTPAYSGTLQVEGKEYTGGKIEVKDPTNIPIQFMPTKQGNITLAVTIFDKLGCKTTKNLSFNVANPGIVLTIGNKQEDIILNKQTNFNLSVSKLHYEKEFNFEVIQEPLNSGIVKINGAGYVGGLTTIDNPKNTVIGFTPNNTGNVNLKIKVTDEFGGESVIDVPYSVSNSDITLDVINGSYDLMLDKESEFTFSANKPNYSGKFTYKIDVEPVGAINLKINSNNYSGGEIETSSIEDINVSMNPKKEGSAKLTITIKDEFGGVKTKDLTFNIVNPTIDLTVENQSLDLIIGKQTSFFITAEKANYKGKFNYSIASDVDDYGKVSINGSNYYGGELTASSLNKQEVRFTPAKEGTLTLTVTVIDDYGTQVIKKSTFRVTNPEITANVTNYSSSAINNKASVFNVALSKDHYTDDFYCTLALSDPLTGTLKIDGNTYNGGKVTVDDPNNLRVEFTPIQDGTVNLTMTFTDKIGGEFVKVLSFNVVNPPIDLMIANTEKTLTVDQPTTFNLAVSKSQYTGEFQYEIVQNPLNSGTIKVNNRDYTGGREDISNTSNTQVVFTPTKVGDVSLTVKVYDQFGGERSQDVTYKVNNSVFKVVVSGQESNVILGKQTTFNFAALKENYNRGYDYEIISTEGAGTINVGGNAYMGGSQALTNPENTVVSFLPKKEGNVSITVRLEDELGGTAEKTISYNVTNPEIVIGTSGFSSSAILNKKTGFNFDLSKEYYTDNYNFSIAVSPIDAGKVFVNGSEYTGGTNSVRNPLNTRVDFTPERAGQIDIMLTIEDEVGGTKTKTYTYNVVNPALNLNIGTYNPAIVVNTKNNVSFDISKSDYTEGFKYQIVTNPSDAGTIKVNGSDYYGGKVKASNPDNMRIEFTPTTVGSVDLIVTAYDQWGLQKAKEVNYNVNNTPMDITITGKESSVIVNKPTTFNFAVSKENYSGGYRCQVTTIPANVGTLQINGSAYSAGSYLNVSNPDNMEVEFHPTKEGAVNVYVTVTDDYSGAGSQTASYNVKNPAIDVNVTSYNKAASIYKIQRATATISKPYYSGEFDFTISQSPASSGTIEVNGTDYSGGLVKVNEPGNMIIDFTPTRTGNVTLTLTVKDRIGGSTTHDFVYNVTNAPIVSNVSNVQSSIALGAETTFNFDVSKQNYPSGFQFEIIQSPLNSGTLKVGNSAYSGGKQDIRDEANTLIKFTPNKLGAVTLTLKIYDEWYGSTTKTINYNVTNTAISVTQSFPTTGLLIGESQKITYAISKPDYSGNFKYELSTSNSNLTGLKVNGSAYAGGKVAVDDPKKMEVEITGAHAGNCILTLKVYDDFGGERITTINYSVMKPELSVTGGLTKSCYVNESVSFDYVISQSGPAINYSVKIPGVGDYTKQAGNYSFSVTPTTAGVKTYTVNVTDSYGQTKSQTYTLNVTKPALSVTGGTTKSCYVNESVSFNYTISQDGPAISYDVAITGKGNSNKNKGSHSFTIKPTTAGAKTYKVNVTDSYGQTKSQTYTLNVSNRPTNSISIAQNLNAQYEPNNTGNFIIRINSNDSDNEYTASASISGGGTLNLNGSSFSNGTKVHSGSGTKDLSFSYTQATEGNASITITIKDKFGKTYSKTVSTDFVDPKPTLSVEFFRFYNSYKEQYKLHINKPVKDERIYVRYKVYYEKKGVPDNKVEGVSINKGDMIQNSGSPMMSISVGSGESIVRVELVSIEATREGRKVNVTNEYNRTLGLVKRN